jgi:putative phosphoesterase
MTRIGIISDTHGYLDNNILKYFSDCDEIWHAGDIGNINVINQLMGLKKLRAVYGNIDGTEVRAGFKQDELFAVENCKVLLTHIAGKPYTFY